MYQALPCALFPLPYLILNLVHEEWIFIYFHFIDKETEAQRRELASPKPRGARSSSAGNVYLGLFRSTLLLLRAAEPTAGHVLRRLHSEGSPVSPCPRCRLLRRSAWLWTSPSRCLSSLLRVQQRSLHPPAREAAPCLPGRGQLVRTKTWVSPDFPFHPSHLVPASLPFSPS